MERQIPTLRSEAALSGRDQIKRFILASIIATLPFFTARAIGGSTTQCTVPRLAEGQPQTYDVMAEELAELSDCVRDAQIDSYGTSGHWVAGEWNRFTAFSKRPFRSDAHSGRFVATYVSNIGSQAYGRYDELAQMPIGSTIAQPSFTVEENGNVTLGPLFIMEKLVKGWSSATADWRYTMIMPGGKLFGMTGGENSAGLQYCHDCHTGAADNDFMLFVPEEVRM